MDFFQSHQTVPLLSYLLPYSERSIALVKRLAGSPKGAEIDPNLPHANKSYLAHAFLYTWMDSLSVAPKPKPLLSSFHIPERSIALVKHFHQKELKLIPTCPTLKVLLQGTRILIYIDGLFQSHQTVPKPLLSYLLPYSRTFNCTSKTTGWFTKGAEIDPNLPHANKSVTQGSTRILIYMDGLLQSPTSPSRCYLYLLPYSERSIALVKRLAGSPKGAEIDPNLPHANKSVTPR
jgi:hypothetical protein